MEQLVLVDDEPMMLKAITRLLARIPCAFDGQVYPLKVISFTDPYAALDYVQAHAVSLILSDYRITGCRRWMASPCSAAAWRHNPRRHG